MTLTDGRGELYQWDTGRTLTVDDATVTQVHFQNRAYGRTIDVDVNNSVAIIPDEILQKPGELRVYAFSGTAESGFTKIERVFNIVRRNKPNDYMYTPTEQKSLEGLQKQIGDLSELKTDAKADIVTAINETATAGQTLGLTGATVGQVPAVKAVDGNGAPTEWEAVEFPEQVQSDWKQTDETAADYVKNRPFGLVAYDGIFFERVPGGYNLVRVPDLNALANIQGSRKAEIRCGGNVVNTGSANVSVSDYDGSISIKYTSAQTIIRLSGSYGTLNRLDVQQDGGITNQGEYVLHIDGLYYEEYIKLSADSVEGTLPSASAADCALISTGSGNNWSVTKISTDFPLASATGRGAVKVGDGLSISSDGKLSVDMSGLDTKSLGLTGATVGQTVKIKAVDENGIPTEWEATDMASGGDIPAALPNPYALTFTGAVTGSYDGSQAVTVEIPSGKDGADGYTPVKGVDYWTASDQEEINADNIAYISTELAKRNQLVPEFANSVDECTDTSKLYVLPDGYIYAYMTKTATVYPTNQLGNAIDSDGTPYNGGTGYKDDTRLSLSSGETAKSGYTATGFMEVQQGDTIRFANIDTAGSASNNEFIIFYGADFAYVGYLRSQAALDALIAGKCVLDSNLTLSDGTLDGTVYFRVSMRTGNGDYLITVNEPLEPTTTTTQGWHNTGHAFVPADYENRIVDLEERVDELSAGNSNTPAYITEEAKRVANIVKEKQTVGSLTFTAMSDMHIRFNDSYWEDNLTSCRDAGLGLAELRKLLKLDCAVMLGDYTVGGASDTVAQIKEDLTGVKDYMANGAIGIPNIWLTGNHDINYGKNTDRRMTEDEMFAYLTNNNSCTTQDWENIGRNYGYIDFENQKIRCIYLNTVDSLDYPDNTDGTADDSSEITAIQTKWLVDNALNLSSKSNATDWGIVVLSHHCICQFQHITAVLTAYKNGTSGSVSVTTNGVTTTVDYNFASVNCGEIICAIHGHDHNFTYRKISTERWDQVTEANAWLWSICVPNVDTKRNNEKATNEDEAYRQAFGEFDSSGNPVYYPKTQGTATSTSFCVITIDRKNRKIHATAYGAGIDREISY